eukprot:TRINITY_DN14401_c0_g1_i1.p1 TRINITY_DN14401_c0_g1~~TRINITY_DN14401_c0_g1_i1.p1  ORF type:complete len:382 (+),score=64.91 TRINITY_DN14401_c0_g1_i1:61-1206(+)
MSVAMSRTSSALRCVVLSATLLVVLRGARLMNFEAFVAKHKRSYERGSTEFEARRKLFEERLAQAEAQNARPDRLWTAGVNKLWDWTEAELKTLRGWDGSARPSGTRGGTRPLLLLQEEKELPEEKIWSDTHAAKHVRNQADCGSCWAIATATVLEAHAEIHTGTIRTFSAEQIVQCTPNPRHCGGDGGCQGATAELAMQWVLEHGCDEENDVPYTATDGKCSKKDVVSKGASFLAERTAGGAAFGMSGWTTLPKNEYMPLVKALAEQGPVAVSVAADLWSSYESGVFDQCGRDAVIDHAVTAIGYGKTDKGIKFFTIQNSWGQDWGEEGKIRLLRHDGEDKYCGMNNDPQKGVACKGETDPVPVCGMCGVLFDSVVPQFH